MNISKWPLFKKGLFRQAKYLLSAPQQAQMVAIFDNQRNVWLDMMPSESGWCYTKYGAWEIDHSKLIRIPGIDELVLPISLKTRYPLDPHDKRNNEEKRKASSLDALFAVKHDEAMFHIEEQQNQSPNLKVLNTVLWIVGSLAGIALVIGYFASRGGH